MFQQGLSARQLASSLMCRNAKGRTPPSISTVSPFTNQFVTRNRASVPMSRGEPTPAAVGTSNLKDRVPSAGKVERPYSSLSLVVICRRLVSVSVGGDLGARA